MATVRAVLVEHPWAAPEADRPQGDRPRFDRPQGDRPRFDRPQGDRPRFDRSTGRPDRPAFRPGPTGLPDEGGGLPAPDLLGENEEIVAGRRPVEEAFVARRSAIRLLVVPQRRQALEKIVLHATSLRIPIVEVEGGTLTSVAGFDGHQGVALVVGPRKFATLDDVLERARERGEPPFVLALDSLEDPQNVGTLLRSAEAVGVHGVIFPTHRQAPLSAAAVKASAGAVEHLLLVPVDDLPGALADLHVRGLRVAGADGDAPLSARQADLRGPLTLVVGSEGQGIGPPVRRRCDFLVRIPMRGIVGSLNAAVAGSVLLFEVLAQRDPTGASSTPPRPRPMLPTAAQPTGAEEASGGGPEPAGAGPTRGDAEAPGATVEEARRGSFGGRGSRGSRGIRRQPRRRRNPSLLAPRTARDRTRVGAIEAPDNGARHRARSACGCVGSRAEAARGSAPNHARRAGRRGRGTRNRARAGDTRASLAQAGASACSRSGCGHWEAGQGSQADEGTEARGPRERVRRRRSAARRSHPGSVRRAGHRAWSRGPARLTVPPLRPYHLRSPGVFCGVLLRADVAQLVEQRFCKPPVPGSSPVVGSN